MLATSWGLLFFLIVVGENPTEKENASSDHHDGYNDTHRGSHLFN